MTPRRPLKKLLPLKLKLLLKPLLKNPLLNKPDNPSVFRTARQGRSFLYTIPEYGFYNALHLE